MHTQAPHHRRLAAVLGSILAAGVALLVALAAPAQAGHHSASGDAKGSTGGWYDGRDVTFFYPKSGFCDRSVPAGSDSGCIVGAEANRAPRPGKIPTLYVMVPLFPGVDPATLQCPTAGSCVNHPSTLDLSPVFGAGAANTPLPPHSHVVDVRSGGWWELEVVGVTTAEAWDELVAGKSLDTVRELQAAGTATGDIPTNAFLFFNVRR